MKFLKALTQKKIAKAVVCGLVLSGGMVVGMGQAYAETYISGAVNSWGLWFGNSEKGDKVVVSETETANAEIYNGNLIYGYYPAESGTLKKGTVEITGGTIGSVVYGGLMEEGDVNNNKVTVSGGTLSREFYGGYTKAGSAENNTVTISGGEAKVNVTAGQSSSGNANNNTIAISGGTVTKNVFAGYSAAAGDAGNNTVTISGGAITGSVYSGYSQYGNANNNILNIKGGTITGSVLEGYSAANGTANNNTLTISGGSMKSWVMAGWAAASVANNNTVNLIGKNGALKVVTGYKDGNKVEETVANSGDIDIANYVYGGYGNSSNKGNTLNIAGTGTKVGGITSFQKLNFYIPKDAVDGAVMVSATNAVNLQNIEALNTVTSDEENATVGYTPGKTITLLSSKNAGNDFTVLSKEKLKIDGVAAVEKDFGNVNITGITQEVKAVVGYDISKQKIDFTTTYKLQENSDVTDDVIIKGKLDLNGKDLNMQQAVEATAQYNTLTVNKLTGTGSLMVDADFNGNKSDKIHVKETGSDATVNITSILLRSDGLNEGSNENPFSFITGDGANDVKLIYGTNGTIETATSDYIYTFNQNEESVTITKASAINCFIAGTTRYKDTVAFDVTKDTIVKTPLGTLNTAEDSTRGKELTLGINKNVSLKGSNDVAGITVADGYTLNVKGETLADAEDKLGSITGFAAALTNNGTLNVENINLNGNDKDIVNNAGLTFAGTNTVNDITGTGTMNVNAGETTISKGLTQDNAKINGGKLALNGTTALKSLEVGAGATLEQNSGSFVVEGDVTNSGNITLAGLGGTKGAELDQATNKITGKLTNNGVFMVKDNTHLTVNEFAGDVVDVASDSSVTIAALKDDLNVTADSIINDTFNVNKVKNTITVVPNSQDVGKPVAVASSFDKALAEIEDKGIGQFAGLFEGDGKLVVPEGILDGETTFDKNGMHKAKGATDDVVDSLATAATFARVEINDIRKRMGDVRQVKDTKGIWARSENGKMEGQGMDSKFHKFQIGSDNALSDKWRVGGAVSYTNGNTHYNHGSNSNKTYSGAAYGMYTGKNGEFVDVIARVGMDKTKLNFTAGGVQQHGDLDRMAYALSSEVGKTYELKNSFYVEPQAELTYTYTGSDDFTSNGAKYDLDSANSFIGRLGFTLGYKNDNNGGVYTRLSLLHEFAGDKDLTASNAGITKNYSNDGKDSWVEWAIGGQIQTSKATYIYADAEKTFGANINEKYRVNVGLRYSF